jgi:SAM-dependent methyltransferase
MTTNYTSAYFSSEIFVTDYASIAQIIVDRFTPQRILDVGCGPGHLSREFALLGKVVMAIDGFSSPDFNNLPIRFMRVDLNNPQEIVEAIGREKFDLVVCLEVAEHLRPEVSEGLIEALTAAADVVIFSAGVPNQGGNGHINLKPRDFWHGQFHKSGFVCGDQLRSILRGRPQVAQWYRLNVLDYVRKGSHFEPDPEDVIARLVASESNAASEFYQCWEHLQTASYQLNVFPVNVAIRVRQLAKKVRRRIRGNV